ncbi:hypothetical protein P378_05100 [Desulforamulus profundi]|uniref:PKD domain-containing protein n=1 Tax=Desulforamulus profundi TaxID=1383067 RepID=A0A2C6L3I2_9FIRM|nr:hypothetical protein [Desulforamulus profundi]PHJ39151.1 hypothetical protein P378_05100 [Desulforamulus profundi]
MVIKNRSYDPDGEIKEVKWTLEIPTGGVIKKSSDNSVVTQFTEDENRVYFDKEGTYKVTIEVTDDWGKKDSTTETIVVKPAIPNAYFEPVGPYKQNRKLQFVAGGSSPSRYPIITNLNQWVIEPVTSGLTADDIKIRLENPDNKGERVLLFKKPGQYRVKLKVTNTAGHTSEWYEKLYDIQPDAPPVADFNVQSAYLRNPEDRNVSELLIRDLSYSPDGDVINKRVWKYKFDSDNDGSFDDETFIVFDAANNPSPVIRTSHVGKYLVELEVTEGFGEPTGTLDEFISPEDYLKANTDNKPLQEKKTEVINVQPVVAFEAQRKKMVDIVFTVGDVDAGKVWGIDNKIDIYIKSKLQQNGIYSNITKVNVQELKNISNSINQINWNEGADRFVIDLRDKPSCILRVESTGYNG